MYKHRHIHIFIHIYAYIRIFAYAYTHTPKHRVICVCVCHTWLMRSRALQPPEVNVRTVSWGLTSKTPSSTRGSSHDKEYRKVGGNWAGLRASNSSEARAGNRDKSVPKRWNKSHNDKVFFFSTKNRQKKIKIREMRDSSHTWTVVAMPEPDIVRSLHNRKIC